jgi:hypothetical protein
MYENGKMRPAETVPGMGGGGTKENGREGEFNYDIYIYFFFIIHMCIQGLGYFFNYDIL